MFINTQLGIEAFYFFEVRRAVSLKTKLLNNSKYYKYTKYVRNVS